MKKKICMSFQENKDIQVGDNITVKLPHEESEREFVVVKLDHSFRNLPVVEYQGKELLIDRSMVLKIN